MLTVLLTLASGFTPLYEPFDMFPMSQKFDWQVANIYTNVDLSDVNPRAGKGCIRFTVKPGDFVAGGERAEFQVFREDPLESEVWYAYSLMVPDYYSEALNQKAFQIMGQWHDRPPIGVSWNEYESHQPLLATKYNRNVLSFVYGIGAGHQVIMNTGIIKGRWVDLVFHLRWSITNEGYVEIFKDGKRIVKKFGANMYNERPAMFKLGLYRKKDAFVTSNTIFFDELKIGATLRELYQ